MAMAIKNKHESENRIKNRMEQEQEQHHHLDRMVVMCILPDEASMPNPEVKFREPPRP